MRYYLFLCVCMAWGSILFAQVRGFERALPPNIQFSFSDQVVMSSLYYKEGKQSLEWNFHPQSTLYIPAEHPFILNTEKEETYGIQLWVYNETEGSDSLSFEFLSPDGEASYRFAFRLAAVGWRACWINFRQMQGKKMPKEIAGCRLVAPSYEGRIFLDRMTFPTIHYNLRTTPDMQMPCNNSLESRDLWHWCRTWEWEQYEYDWPLAECISKQERIELECIEQKLDRLVEGLPENANVLIAEAEALYQHAGIRHSGNGYVGAPIVSGDDGLQKEQGEITLNEVETMLAGFAYDAYYHHSETARQRYLQVWDFAMNQGFAYGSGMGTNHHYGYQIDKIYSTAWLMREKIRHAPHGEAIISTLQYWSALQETRKPCPPTRDELLDSWHTLLIPKVIAALFYTDEREKARAMKGLSRWVSTSLCYTDGTIGGIKIDGTTFHHGGFYPAYTTGAMAIMGKFVYLTTGTAYLPTQEARLVLRSALWAMRNYCNKYVWGIGISGRHPFGTFGMSAGDVAAFAYLALAGDLSGEGNGFDRLLAADYLRLCQEDTPEARFFKREGIRPAPAPQGFFVYNYGSAGIFRRNGWMVTLKGYTTDVWGAEIYAHDNRYGRYQSYGSIQIQGYPSYKASGFDENGWDWNRLPGTTAIHLPWHLLDSPLPGTTMAHSKENFSGSSSLAGNDGMFAMKLMERNLRHFTPDFVARKSAFCFGNRIICLGSDIKNSNAEYPTETILFQGLFCPGKDYIVYQGDTIRRVGFRGESLSGEKNNVVLKDSYENYYYVREGKVKAQITRQESRQNKTRELTSGTFASAWIDHGKSPQGASYEYLIWIQPAGNELGRVSPLESYQVMQRDRTAHIIYDRWEHITAYVVFDSLALDNDDLFLQIPSETMVMRKPGCDHKILMSVCDPNLNIAEKSYTTHEPSRIIRKVLVLRGKWKIETPHRQVTVTHEGNNTRLTIDCRHGRPVEFEIARQKE